MSNTAFREKIEPSKPEEQASHPKSDVKTPVSDTVEVPYTDAENFLGEYFKLGTEWKDQDAVFEEEVRKIDLLIKNRIDSGEIANSQKAARNLLADMEKMNNLRKESRPVVKLEVLANYAEFLTKNEHLKSNLRRYSGSS